MQMQSEQINELAQALAKAQAEMKPAAFDKINPHFKNKYASLASFIDACKQPLNKYGLSFIQSTSIHEKGTVLVTKLMHSSGQWVAGELLVMQDRPGIQAFGSQLTYSKRYALSSMLGIAADDDDDGELDRSATASRAEEKKKEPPVTKLSVEQAKFLQNLLNGCDEGYRNWFNNHLSDRYGTTQLSDLPSDVFVKIKESIEKNAHKNRTKKESSDQIDASELLGVK